MSKKVKIFEVGLRDGLQYEKKTLSIEVRKRLALDLIDAGVQNLEIGAFVNPERVPQMIGTDKVVSGLIKQQYNGKISMNTNFSALVPNEHGMMNAVGSGINEVAVFTAASKTFALKNINCTPKESLKRFAPVMRLAKKFKMRVRGYISTCFGCPFEGRVSEKQVVDMAERLFDLGVYELSIGDTIGVATPQQVKSLSFQLFRIAPTKKIALHFHDTRGTAIANVLEGLDVGIRTFDSSIGGLGGCPFAKGAQGNVATEDVIYMLNGMGFETGIDLKALIKINYKLQKILGHGLPAKLSKAGVPWWQ
ncbi:MAG: hydroxymethylglutaryl-CoA lyase [Proteobacteria bacterium SG_bin7]|nr:MAG: hydroxymethylglutaryl-CoA lyase [Proteobacteria bacterium SG_bin7]